MLKNYIVTISLWGGDKIVEEKVSAQNPTKAKIKACDSVHKRTKIPFAMIEAQGVRIEKK